uniref:Uncharacterized protein n=2 Tax=Meloidogyne incognita TaxID=6306 RepID=A0A914NRC4_MELIC
MCPRAASGFLMPIRRSVQTAITHLDFEATADAQFAREIKWTLALRRVSQLTNDKKKMSANANIARNVLALDCIFLSSNTLRLSALPSIPKMTRDGNRYLCKYHSNSEPVGN